MSRSVSGRASGHDGGRSRAAWEAAAAYIFSGSHPGNQRDPSPTVAMRYSPGENPFRCQRLGQIGGSRDLHRSALSHRGRDAAKRLSCSCGPPTAISNEPCCSPLSVRSRPRWEPSSLPTSGSGVCGGNTRTRRPSPGCVGSWEQQQAPDHGRGRDAERRTTPAGAGLPSEFGIRRTGGNPLTISGLERRARLVSDDTTRTGGRRRPLREQWLARWPRVAGSLGRAEGRGFETTRGIARTCWFSRQCIKPICPPFSGEPPRCSALDPATPRAIDLATSQQEEGPRRAEGLA